MSSTQLSSAALDRNLAAFDWLILGTSDYSKWDGDRLINTYKVNGKQMCKVCDAWLKPSEIDKHVKLHISQDVARREKIKAQLAAEREAQKEFVRTENEAMKPIKERKEKVKSMSDTAVAVAPTVDTSAVAPLFDGGVVLTIADLESASGLDKTKLRPIVKSLLDNGTIVDVGKVETGKRGRPARKYQKADA